MKPKRRLKPVIKKENNIATATSSRTALDNSSASTGHLWSILPSQSSKEICSHFLEGKYSIVSNLPHPEIREIDGHAYVSVKDCVQQIF